MAVHQLLRQERAKNWGNRSTVDLWVGFGLNLSLSPYEYGDGLLHARRLGSTAVLGSHNSFRRHYSVRGDEQDIC
jgi:uncharacterized protein YidB (DUF937 family)